MRLKAVGGCGSDSQHGFSFPESVAMNLTMIQLPFFMIYVSLLGRCSKKANGHPFNRVLNDKTEYYVLSYLSVQLQAISGSSLMAYANWAEQKKLKEVVDDLGDTRFGWVGPRETKHVVIYCHRGGFVGPLSGSQVEFWYRIQQALKKKKNLKLGVAVLQYSTYPAFFPTQLNELLLAIEHLMSMGVSPPKIRLAGDSAGANIIPQRLRWHLLNLALREYDDSFDLVPAKCFGLWTDTHLSTTPESHRVYIQPDTAPKGWLAGLHKITKRILITAGRNELLYDSIVGFSEAVKEVHGDVRLDMQDGGVHCDAMFDIGAGSTAPHSIEKRVTDWFAETLEKRKVQNYSSVVSFTAKRNVFLQCRCFGI
ncbi:hypothetical protein B0H17DRAFT_1325386 [Mycena rosella]|uniref:Alpha/beta hydrolase fold-3 domain-containing protein n=1 Tax=Mycena rosella TaxID=1033263 RepID=A0AAD7MA56_MYCRO|nr:hypothetical protein B0H17DRAFT_1325386 [Mycena rosella]